MEGVGSTPSTSLVDWYVRAVSLIDNRRKLVRQMKKIVRECGGEERARQVLVFHLSSGWRRRNAKSLEYVLSQLDRYKAALGMDDQETRLSVERGGGFPDVVFVSSALAEAEV